MGAVRNNCTNLLMRDTPLTQGPSRSLTGVGPLGSVNSLHSIYAMTSGVAFTAPSCETYVLVFPQKVMACCSLVVLGGWGLPRRP